MADNNGYKVHASVRHGIEVWDVIHWVCGVPMTREATYLSPQSAEQWVQRQSRKDGAA